MATTFVVEDGTGLSTANSYLSEAAADQYHENFGNPVAWSGATTAVKEDALRHASRYLDGTYINRWRGYRASRDQALDWPRRAVEDPSGWFRLSDALPFELENACAIMALKHIADSTDLLPDVSAGDTGVSRELVRVGPITEDKTFTGSKSSFKQFSLVTATLRPLLQKRAGRVRA